MAQALEPNQISLTVDGYGSETRSEISLNSNINLKLLSSHHTSIMSESAGTQFKEPNLLHSNDNYIQQTQGALNTISCCSARHQTHHNLFTNTSLLF